MKADAELRQDVEAELAWDPEVSSPHISVTARDGVVTLEGTVPSLTQKLAAERAAQRVSGVRALAMELEVRLPDEGRRADEEIAAAARRALDWTSFVPRDQVQVTVDHGRVTLNGEVEQDYQRAAAERAVRGLRGITSLSNRIGLASPIDARGLERGIADALARQAGETPSRLSVRVHGTTVRLAGHVRSWAERDAAAHAAWSAPGVAQVVNDVVVSA